MLRMFSSVHRTSVPLYHWCKYRELHKGVKVKKNSQLLNVISYSLEVILTRDIHGEVCEPVRCLGNLNAAQIDTDNNQRNFKEHILERKTQHCSNENNFDKIPTVLHVCHEGSKSIEDLLRKTCSRFLSISSNLSLYQRLVELKYLLTLHKSLTVYQQRKCSCSTKKSVENRNRTHNAGSKMTFCSTKTDNCLKFNSRFHTSAMLRNQHVQDNNLREKPPWRVMFFGTDDIALHTLKELHLNMIESGTLVESLEVVTVKDHRQVAAFAEKENLKIHDWPLTVQTGKYDVGVLASFGHLIPDDVIHMFPYGILNMHPSLLPRWRGASPVIHSILNNDKVSGVSIMDIRPRHFDIGPLLLQRSCKIPYRCTSSQMAEILGKFGANMMMECLKDLPTLERFEHEQDEAGITYAHKIKKKNANIDWHNNTAEEIDCQYRALSEMMPLKSEYEGQTIKLLNVVDPSLFKDVTRNQVKGVKGEIMDAEPGTVGYHKPMKCIVVKCKRGIIGFRNIVLEKYITASDFRNGYINKNEYNKYTKFNSLDNDLNKYIKVKKLSASATG